MNQVIHGDCLEKLKDLVENSIDLVCTDPPYGIGFMGKEWDKPDQMPTTFKDTSALGNTMFKNVSGPKFRRTPKADRVGFQSWVTLWASECLRIMKPGAFMFVSMTPRQDMLSRMMIGLEDAGLETGFTSIYWTYASGFPKAMNIGKMVDKRSGIERENGKLKKKASNMLGMMNDDGWQPKDIYENSPATDQAKALDGSYGGFQPKPAVEVIIVAMKPLSEKTYVDQALKNGKGITWLDDVRIPTDFVVVKNNDKKSLQKWKELDGREIKEVENPDKEFVNSRFPANLLVSDRVLNDGRNFTISKPTKNHEMDDNVATEGTYKRGDVNFGSHLDDQGGYSRYFDLDKWWAKTFPFLVVPKAAKSEKDKNLEDWETKQANNWNAGGIKAKRDEAGLRMTKNIHPTVKPLKLMSYLIMLGSRKGDTVLDPFAGSGTTLVAAQDLDRKFIGIEREEEYIKIIKARLEEKQMKLL